MFLRLPKNPTSRLVILPFDKPPLNLNDRLHRMEHARRVSTIREATVWTARAARLPKGLPHVWVEFIYRAPDRRNRDADNLVATLKPVADALASGDSMKPGYGMTPDDSPRYMTKIMPYILDKDDPRLPQLPPGACAVLLSWEAPEGGDNDE